MALAETETRPCVRCARAEDSAAAALATVAQFHHLPIRSAEVAPLVGLPSVTELGDLVVATRLLGLESVPLAGDYDDLPEVPRPSIVLFKDGRFVVLYEIDAASVRVADPLAGIQRLTRDEFSARWTGDCLQLEPGAGWLEEARARLAVSRSPWKRLTAPPRAPKALFAVAAVAASALVAAHALGAWALALGVAALGSLWLVLFPAACAQCSRARQLAGVLPLDRLGALFYPALLLAALFRHDLVPVPLFAAAGAHVALLALLARDKVKCVPCLVTGAAALGAAGLVGWNGGGAPLALALAAGAGATAVVVTLPFLRRIADYALLWDSRRVALDYLRGAGPVESGKARVVVWKRRGCTSCLFYDAVFKPALEHDFQDGVLIEERDGAGLGVPTPLILVAGSVPILFVGLPGRDDDYEALRQAVASAQDPALAALTGLGGLHIVVPPSG